MAAIKNVESRPVHEQSEAAVWLTIVILLLISSYALFALLDKVN